MSVICPTITTSDPHEYREQLELIASYSDGIHIDFADGELAPTTLLPIAEAWRSDDVIVHAHVMYQKPSEVIEDIMHLEADLVILHAESDNLRECLEVLQENGTRTGIAILPETSVAELREMDIDDMFDHVLVFAGTLGSQGAKADMSNLKKVLKLREEYPDVEIGWDGGVNLENAKEIIEAGVDVLNVGGYFKKAENPKKAYESMLSLIQS